HAGLPLKTVLEQLDLLGGEVVPVLREEFAKNRPSTVPDAPTHENLKAADAIQRAVDEAEKIDLAGVK
ncbi:MAG TPA: 5,10-methylene tetrahydromethanopterin reductase, partial [Terrimesophilobacter sp.]|nr:5,10-methylene tetrahydromethanopterin reductase [Terrimesophilobacter sp.]